MTDYSVITYGAYSSTDAFYLSSIEKVCRRHKFSAQVTTEDMKVDGNTLDLVIRVIKEVTRKDVEVTRSKISLYDESSHISENLIEAVDGSFGVIVDVRSTDLIVEMLSDDREMCILNLGEIVKKIPVAKLDKDPHIVPFNFWNIEGASVNHSSKNINCPLISEIEGNYAPEVMRGLSFLAGLEKPDSVGKIIIFSGPPGTGKTTAVRSLAREWAYRLGASVEIFLDPEELLASSGYMNKVILDVDSRVKFNTVDDSDELITDEKSKVKLRDRLRLVIIEDCADLIGMNCRDKIGFSRFLNVTDGIIGQGLRHVFLLTANEELGRLDPAVTRRGRCIKSVEFRPFTQREAIRWLKQNNVDHANEDMLDDEIDLADLYAIKTGIGAEEDKQSSKIGF